MIRILLVGDVRVTREGVAELLRQHGRFAVVDAPPTAVELEALLRDVDVVVLDTGGELRVPDASGLIQDAQLPTLAFGLAVDEDDFVLALAEAGVTGFIARESAVEDFAAGIEAIAQGNAWCPPPFANTLLRWVAAHPAPRPLPKDSSNLTSRELEIVALIEAGLSNKGIAARLYISEATVKNHVHNILDKLDVRKRAEVAPRMRLVENEQRALAAHRVRATRSIAG